LLWSFELKIEDFIFVTRFPLIVEPNVVIPPLLSTNSR
jgi:hypothetical protein